jgi:5-methyltetrahydrofolate--homocysteine methyltransferase
MKEAVSYLENFLERKEGTSKGTIVVATVYGDVHDIGKNLVKTILSNNGYTVIDLGKQVPAETIISKAQEVNADAIGLSALLVNTSKQMPLIVNELHRRQLNFPVLLGGAAINRRFGWRIYFTDEGSPHKPGVFYCKDAFEGLQTMDALIDPQKRKQLLSMLHQKASHEIERELVKKPSTIASPSAISITDVIPKPQTWGPHVVRQMPLELIFQFLAKNELFRLSWGAKNARGEEWQQLKTEFEIRLENMKRQALRENWLAPQGVYGYWPAQSKGEELLLYDPDQFQDNNEFLEVARFRFPRQRSDKNLCLADYFAPVESGLIDLAALQVVTVGDQTTQRFDHLEAQGNYSEAYYTHGLAVQTAEAAAEYLHGHIRSELGLAQDRGKRYSWGYPAIPDLADHRILFDLLPAESELGMSLTSAYQLVPEQSTAAILVFHPEAKYFNIGMSRLEQLEK